MWNPFTRRNLFSAKRHNNVANLVHSLCNLQVVRGSKDKITVTESNAILELKRVASDPGTGTGNVNYRGAWTALNDYEVNDLVFISPREFYIAEAQSGPLYGGAAAPSFPEPGTIYWRCVSPATTAQIAKVSAHYGDYLAGALWSGTAWGSTINIAKPVLLRYSITSYSNGGITVNYSSYNTSNQTRSASFTSTSYSGSEVQTIVRPYKADDIIWVAKTNKTLVEVSSVELQYIDLNVDARAWAKKYSV